ncbi:MAG: hypothetical protein ACKOEM_14455 [Planctomycetia bacterium]
MTRLSLGLVAAGCVWGLTQGLASAAPITVLNHSFESGPLYVGSPAAVTDWGLSSTTAVIGVTTVVTPTQWNTATTPDGTNRYLFSNTSNSFARQTIQNHTIQSGTYTLSVDLGLRKALTQNLTGVSLQMWSLNGGTFENMAATTIPTANIPVGTWQSFSTSVEVTGTSQHLGRPLMIQFQVLNGQQLAMDNVRLDFTAAVPEPGMLGLLSVGGLACAAQWHRKRWRPARIATQA